MRKDPPVIPFSFVLERLSTLPIDVRPMFGCYAIYHGERMLLILRDKKEHAADNGVWVAIAAEHLPSLKNIFPKLRSVRLLGGKRPTVWQNLPKSSGDFEESVVEVCEMILKGDARIGKIPLRKDRAKRAIRKR